MWLQALRLLRRASVVLFLVLLAGTSSLWAETFSNPRLLSTNSNPVAVVQGDFNGDGKPDLIYLDAGATANLHVLLGNGDGTFQDVQSIPFDSVPLAIADVNKDGKPDLIIGIGGQTPAVIVLLGNGDGTFSYQYQIRNSLPTTSASPAIIAGVGVGDFNGDGAADLIVTDQANNYVYVLLGNNTGSFTLKSTISLSTGPTTVWAGDLNGDGREDFLVSNLQSGDTTIFLGDGDGTFQAPVRYVGGRPLLVDVDGDGHPDLVLDTGNAVQIYQGNPNGTFATTPSASITNLGNILQLVGVADFNGDGILDIAVLSGNGVTILLGKGSLTYAPSISYGVGSAPIAVLLQLILNPQAAMADFNKDGHLDFAVVAPGGIALLFGNADGSFQSYASYNVGTTPAAVAVADFNGDHVADIAVNVGTLTPLIMLGQGGGQFGYTPVSPPTSLNGTSQLLTGDFNGDGKADLLFAAGNFVPDTVLYGNGDGTFSSVAISGLQQGTLFPATVADINHDGISDFAALGYKALEILLGQQNNTFVQSSVGMGSLLADVPAFADFNNDGKLDAVVGEPSSMQVLLGNGDGTFSMGRTLQTEYSGAGALTTPSAMCAADFDGDGNADIVALIGPLQVIQVWYGNGDGSFQDPAFLWLSRAYSQMVCSDVNNDGRPDLALSDGNVITVVHNLGQRNYGPEVQYLAGTVATFVVQDVNGDGAPDIVVANGGSATAVSILLNQSGGAGVKGALSVVPEPSVEGQGFTVTLSLQAAKSGGAVPTGTVSFTDVFGIPTVESPPQVVPLTNGTASFTDTFPVGMGQDLIEAEYSGDATYAPGTFTTVHRIVPLVYSTTTTLSASPTSVLAGQTVSFTATVTSSGPDFPTRLVVLYDGSTTLGTIWLPGGVPVGTPTSNVASGLFDTALLSPGTHVISASYLGDEYSAASTSPPVTVVVSANATSTSLSALPATAQAGAPVSLTAVVTSTSGTPAGGAVFWDGNTAIGTQPLDATGTAVYIASFSGTGTHSLKAVYQQNGSYASSSSNAVNVVVNPSSASSSTSTALVASQGPAGPLTLTATVSAAGGVPTGSVSFYEGGSPVGQAGLDSRGTATVESPALASGTYYFTAYYQGSVKFAPSAGSALWGDTSAKRPDFTLGVAPISIKVAAGQAAAVNVAVIPSNGFSGDVTLSCATGTLNLSCGLSPVSVHGGSGASLLTLTSHPAQGGFLPVRFPGGSPGLWSLVAMLFGLLGLLVARRARFRWAVGAIALLLLGATLGCRAQNMAMLRPSASYSVTVSASGIQAGMQISHVLYVQVNVMGR